MIAGAFGPPNARDLAELTKEISGPVSPISKFSVPVKDLIVGTDESTNILRELPTPNVIPASATFKEFNVPTC